jgi:hypothetical protein
MLKIVAYRADPNTGGSIAYLFYISAICKVLGKFLIFFSF